MADMKKQTSGVASAKRRPRWGVGLSLVIVAVSLSAAMAQSTLRFVDAGADSATACAVGARAGRDCCSVESYGIAFRRRERERSDAQFVVVGRSETCGADACRIDADARARPAACPGRDLAESNVAESNFSMGSAICRRAAASQLSTGRTSATRGTSFCADRHRVVHRRARNADSG